MSKFDLNKDKFYSSLVTYFCCHLCKLLSGSLFKIRNLEFCVNWPSYCADNTFLHLKIYLILYFILIICVI